MRSLLRIWALVFTTSVGFSQRATISGFVRDYTTGESLIGASVYLPVTKSGTSTNAYGFYSLTLPQDSVEVVFSYVGYTSVKKKFFLQRDTTFVIVLEEATLLEEVVVTGEAVEAIHEASSMSTTTIPINQIKALPAFFGEVDVLKTLQLMPGVQAGTEGSTGLYVRGGGPDQNLILLDGVPIYNASHLFGFFSIFNADAINRVELIKGGFPARYGGRLSSVIDISMKDGNMKKVQGEASIGLIASKVTVEGPITKDRTSFIFSARRTYIDALARPIIRLATQQVAGYYFYDLNFKLNHIIDSRNRLYLSTYTGDDRAYSRERQSYVFNNERRESRNEFGLRWGNVVTAARWNHVLSPKLFANLTGTYSRYRFDLFSEYRETIERVNEEPERRFSRDQYISGISDWAGKLDFDYMPNPNHYVRFGTQTIFHRFAPGVYTVRSSGGLDTTTSARITNAIELAHYVEDDWLISNRLKVNAGLHASSFFVDGRSYYSWQPRISGRWLMTSNFALKASYVEMAQFIHLLTNAGLGLPTDLWVPSTGSVRPQTARQAAIGIAKTVRNTYEFSLETYYKRMNNLIEYKDGASFVEQEQSWEDKIEKGGVGTAYGVEVLAQKKVGALTGWVGYTLSYTDRQFQNLNFGQPFPYKFDNRHDINIALAHTWNDKMDFSLAWTFTTGNAITLATQKFDSMIEGLNSPMRVVPELQYFESRNGYRMPHYHRLDVSVSWWKKKKHGLRKWTVGIYNAYNRMNPFFIELGEQNGRPQFIQYSLFPIIPSATYTFKF